MTWSTQAPTSIRTHLVSGCTAAHIRQPDGSEWYEPAEARGSVGSLGYQDDDGVRAFGARECGHGSAGYSEREAEDEGCGVVGCSSMNILVAPTYRAE